MFLLYKLSTLFLLQKYILRGKYITLQFKRNATIFFLNAVWLDWASQCHRGPPWKSETDK